MKGVSERGLREGIAPTNGIGIGFRAWRMASALAVVLLLTSFLGATGVVVALPRQPTVLMQATSDSVVEITLGSMTVTIAEDADAHVFTYEQDGAVFRAIVVEDSEGVRYSINGRPWRSVPLDYFMSRQNPASVLVSQVSLQLSDDPDSHRGATKYWWDGLRFTRGFPAVYPHPDRGYYHILTKSDWRYWGVKLLHHQLGTDQVGAIANAGPYAVGAVIGGVVGLIVGGPIGAAIGAIAGVLIGTILAYVFSVTFVDEAGTIWWWINRSLFHALRSIPWWLWFCGPCIDAYVASHIDYLRVGTLTVNNDLRIWGP